MKFGATIWMLAREAPYDDGIRAVGRLGFRAVELIAWRREVLDEYYTPVRCRELRAIAAGEGVAISNLTASVPGMGSADPAVREGAFAHLVRMGEVAGQLGTGLVNVTAPTFFGLEFPRRGDLPAVPEVTMELPPGLDWARNYDDIAALVDRFGRACEEMGLRWAIEPHPDRVVKDADSALRLFEHVRSPAVGVNLDLNHMFPVGDVPQVAVYRLGSRIVHAHVADNDGVVNGHWRPGKGKIDWRAVLRALRDVGYGGVLSLEIRGLGRPLEQVERDYRLGRDYLAEIAREEGIAIE